jgi:hypothetical protein
MSDYLKYRGKCKEMSEELIKVDPSLTLVRGHYICPIWGEQAHWWTKSSDGVINDPTKDQFPSRGIGEYIEFTGHLNCSECDKEMMEGDEDIIYESNYCFCSTKCAMRFVGLGEFI